jgi:hypothetical protein
MPKKPKMPARPTMEKQERATMDCFSLRSLDAKIVSSGREMDILTFAVSGWIHWLSSGLGFFPSDGSLFRILCTPLCRRKPREDGDTDELTILMSVGIVHDIDDTRLPPADAIVSLIGSMMADTVPEPSRAAASTRSDWHE